MGKHKVNKITPDQLREKASIMCITPFMSGNFRYDVTDNIILELYEPYKETTKIYKTGLPHKELMNLLDELNELLSKNQSYQMVIDGYPYHTKPKPY